MRVLIIEDNPDTAEAFNIFLAQHGHEVCTASCAREAREIASRWQPEVVFLDIGLPQTDGYTLAQQLRSDGLSQARIVALSGHRPSQQQLLTTFIDDYLLKPVRLDTLLAHLNHKSGCC